VPHVFVDTNKFIDFYQNAKEGVRLLDEFAKFQRSFVVTEQMINEFYRNRVATLQWLLKEFQKSIEQNTPYTTSILQELPEHKEVIDLVKQSKDKAKAVVARLNDIVRNITQDPVAVHFGNFVKSAALNLSTTDALVQRAQRRKILGRPPTSPDKHTIGDELIWESLLEGMKDDTVIVTRDKTYLENAVLLQEEAQSAGKKVILITEHLRDAIKALGTEPTPEFVAQEEKIEQERKVFTHTMSGGIRIGGTASVLCIGAEVNGDVHICGNCRSAGPWDGIRCLNCGSFSPD
jgi:hypothetical protein